MRVRIIGEAFPGRAFPQPSGEVFENCTWACKTAGTRWASFPATRPPRSGIPTCASSRSTTAISTSAGHAVQGPRGERFIYLTWGNLRADGAFLMFRRAKLMLDRVDPPAVTWTVAH